MNHKFWQVFAVSGVTMIAVLNYYGHGYLKFYNPVDSLPWKDEAISLFSVTCKRDQSVSLDQLPGVSSVLQIQNPTYSNYVKLWGDPKCHTENDKSYIASWDFSQIWFLRSLPVYSLRLTFDKSTGLLTKQEVLK